MLKGKAINFTDLDLDGEVIHYSKAEFLELLKHHFGNKAEKRPYTDSELLQLAMNHLKDTNLEYYEEMRVSGELYQWAENKVNAVKDLASRLKNNSKPDSQAWFDAVRIEILGLEAD